MQYEFQVDVTGWRMPVRVNLCVVCVGIRRRGSTTGFQAVTAAGASSNAASDGTCCQGDRP